MQVVCQEQAAAAAAATQRREAHKERQVTKVLEASKMRSQRAARVAKLKVGLSHIRPGMCEWSVLCDVLVHQITRSVIHVQLNHFPINNAQALCCKTYVTWSNILCYCNT